MVNTPEEIKLDTIQSAIDAIKAGEIIIVVDDEDRENEGDFICAAEITTPEHINFMATHGRGLICTPIEKSRAQELDLSLMVNNNTAMHSTAFTISIDLIGRGCTTGISAYDRSTGIKAMTDSSIAATDFARPGHIFPLIAKEGGVLRRTGHTEAAIDLARLAGFYPAGVLVEILNDDGTMARLPQLVEVAKKFNLRIISIKDLVSYRLKHESIIEMVLKQDIHTPYGNMQLIAYRQTTNGDIHVALKMGELDPTYPTLVRVHTNYENSDIVANLFDGFNYKVAASLDMIAKEKNGVFLLMRHTSDTFLDQLKIKLGIESPLQSKSDDERDFGVGAQILRDLGLGKMRLLSSHPGKKIGLHGYGLDIVDYLSID